MTAPITYTCRWCGSDDVMLDAWAKWDQRRQEWTLTETFQEGYCRRCDGETRLIERELVAN
jgi:hypothetical protein